MPTTGTLKFSGNDHGWIGPRLAQRARAAEYVARARPTGYLAGASPFLSAGGCSGVACSVA